MAEPKPGDWVRFIRGTVLVLGQVEYIGRRNFYPYSPIAVTDAGTVAFDDIQELRARQELTVPTTEKASGSDSPTDGQASDKGQPKGQTPEVSFCLPTPGVAERIVGQLDECARGVDFLQQARLAYENSARIVREEFAREPEQATAEMLAERVRSKLNVYRSGFSETGSVYATGTLGACRAFDVIVTEELAALTGGKDGE